MTYRRRAPHIVVGAALVVLLALGACSERPQVTVAPAPRTQPATAVATTAPAVPATPTASEMTALPSPVALPTSTPVQIEAPTTEPTATSLPNNITPEPDPTPGATGQQSPPVQPTAVPATGSQPVLVANGAEIYTLTCARCHSENGGGSAQYRSAVLTGVGSKYSTQAMIAELTNGHPVTFGFADRLSVDEIAAVAAYVKSVFP